MTTKTKKLAGYAEIMENREWLEEMGVEVIPLGFGDADAPLPRVHLFANFPPDADAVEGCWEKIAETLGFDDFDDASRAESFGFSGVFAYLVAVKA